MGEEKRYCVYRHIAPNGKMYVGITSKYPFSRWSRNNGSGYINQPYFYNAIKSYNWESFKHEIYLNGRWIPFTDDVHKTVLNVYTKEEATKLEQRFISQYKLRDRRYGYNCTDGGDGVLGYKMSDEQKEKKRILFTGPNNPRYGHKYTEAEKQHLRETNSRWSPSAEQRKKISESLKGHPVSEKTRQALRLANIGRKVSDETRKKLSSSLSGPNHPWYGKHLPELTKRRISESHEKVGVYQVDRETKQIVRHFKSISDAERAVGSRHISAACKGKRFCAKGYIWIYETDLQGLSVIEKNLFISSRCISSKTIRKGAPVVQLGHDGKIVKAYSSIHEASRDTNTQRKSLKLALSGEQKTAGSLIWCYRELWLSMNSSEKSKYIEERSNVQTGRKGMPVVNLTTGKEYSSIREAAYDTAVDQSGISACCYGKQKTCGGYKWMFLS